MNPHHDSPGELFAEWRIASHAEGRAILAGDWPAVEKCQQSKEALKLRILPAAEQWQSKWPRREDGQQEYERAFRPIVSELISLEHRNHEWLRLRRENTEAELRTLDDSSRKLNGLQRAYGSRQHTRWQSYS